MSTTLVQPTAPQTGLSAQVLGHLSRNPQQAAEIRRTIGTVTKSDVNKALYGLERLGLATKTLEPGIAAPFWAKAEEAEFDERGSD